MHQTGRRVLLAAAAAGFARGVWAEGVWERPVTLLVPFSPGTNIDLLARLAAEHLRRGLGVATAVDNRVGASGSIATQAAARAQPDGATLLVTTNTFLTTPMLLPSAHYEPLEDFAPVALLASTAMALCVHASVPAESAAAFAAYARARPEAVDFASPGVGSPQHLAMALFALTAGLRLNHVPYRGSAGALPDLAAGRVAAMFVPANAAAPLRGDGKICMLAIAGARRTPLAPDVPTLDEAGFPGLEMPVWFGVLAPARTPDAALGRLDAEMDAMLRTAAVREVLRVQDLEAGGGGRAAFGAFLRAEQARWAGVIRTAGITGD